MFGAGDTTKYKTFFAAPVVAKACGFNGGSLANLWGKRWKTLKKINHNLALPWRCSMSTIRTDR
jgi:hypothetical protein